jgi:hypothetical protein
VLAELLAGSQDDDALLFAANGVALLARVPALREPLGAAGAVAGAVRGLRRRVRVCACVWGGH